MKTWGLVVGATLLAVSTANCVLADENVLGIYFDEAATQNEIWTAVPGSVTGYLVLTDAAVQSIDTWWLGIDFQTTIHDYALAGGGINLSPPTGDPYVTLFYVEMDTPLPCNGMTVLATLTIGLNEFCPDSCLGITNYFGESFPQDDPGFRSGDQAGYFWPSVGVPAFPVVFPACVAAINQQAPVAVMSETWGGVKTLFK